MKKFLPFTYDPDTSINVYEKTNEYLESNKEISDKISELSWLYHSALDIIPTTIDSFWSGHNFPYVESWEESQISFSQMCFGLYKQSMSSLRSVLELGLLSVYYNINDDGHNAVQKWLNSEDSKEANTPRITDIWKILIKNENIQKFQKNSDLKQRLLNLNYLHNYVHTKGQLYSNRLGRLKSNCQTFEQDYVLKWVETFEEIVTIVMTLHLLKFPNGMISYDYSRKFGIDIPSFSHLQGFQIQKLKKYLKNNDFKILSTISSEDPETINFMEWIESLPEMTENDVENQIVDMDKREIERQGMKSYEKNQLTMYQAESIDQLPASVKIRYDKLHKWAVENDFLEGKINTAGNNGSCCTTPPNSK